MVAAGDKWKPPQVLILNIFSLRPACPCILRPRETQLGQIGHVVGDSSDQPLPSGHTVSTGLGPSLAPPWPVSVLSLAYKSPSSLGLAGPDSWLARQQGEEMGMVGITTAQPSVILALSH